MPYEAERIDRSSRATGWPLALRFVIPLGVIALAYVLWFLSDRLLYIGPLDRATFGWGVVVPLWLATPVISGWAWRDLDRPSRVAAASTLGFIVAIAATGLLFVAMQPTCVYGRSDGSGLVVVLPIVAAAVLAGGLGVSAFQASNHAVAGRMIRAAVAGASIQAVAMFATILVATTFIFGLSGMCQRPS